MDSSIRVAAAGPLGPNNTPGPRGLKTLQGPPVAPGGQDPGGTRGDMHVSANVGCLGGDHPGNILKGVEPLETPKKGFDPLHPVQRDVQF